MSVILKKVREFSIEECQSYLKATPGGPLSAEVKARLDELIKVKGCPTAPAPAAPLPKPAQPGSATPNAVKWIDFKQFMEGKKYSASTKAIIFNLSLFLVSMAIVVSALYFCNTTHFVYRHYDRDSEYSGYSDGAWSYIGDYATLESRLHELDVIEWPSSNNSGSRYSGYKTDDMFYLALVVTILLGLTTWKTIKRASPVKKIYNIDDAPDYAKFRIVQARNGKMGLIKVTKRRLITVVPMVNDEVFSFGPKDSLVYAVKKDNKYGIYSSIIDKLVVPVEYDAITSIGNDTFTLSKGHSPQTFNYKGYRMLN